MLAKDTLEIPFTSGLDTRTERKLAAKLLELSNAVFSGPGVVSPAPGNQALPLARVGGGTLSGIQALANVGGELGAWTTEGFSTQTGLSSAWLTRADANATTVAAVAREQIVRKDTTQYHASSAMAAGVALYAWQEDGTSGTGSYVIRASVVDDATGQTLLADVLLDTSASGAHGLPRVAAVGGMLHVYWLKGTSLFVKVVNPATPLVFGATQTVATDVFQRIGITYPSEFDVVTVTVSGTQRALLCYTSGASGNSLTFRRVLSTGALDVNPPQVWTATTHEGVSLGMSDDTLAVMLVYRDRTAVKVYARRFTPAGIALAGVLDVQGVVNGSASGLRRAAVVGPPSIPGTWTLYLESVGNAHIERAQVADAGATISLLVPASLLVGSSVRMVAAPFLLPGTPSMLVLPVAYGLGGFTQPANSGVQPTGFLVSAVTGEVIARFALGEAAWEPSPVLPRPYVRADGRVSVLTQERGRLVLAEFSNNFNDLTPSGISRVSIQRLAAADVSRTSLGGSVHVGGGLPLFSDGVLLVEDGFNVSPEGLAATDIGAGGLLAAGQYQYRAAFEWVDAHGVVHLSAPSPAVTVNVAVGNSRVSINGPYLNLTRRPNVRVVLFRTEVNETVFYRLTLPGSGIPNITLGTARWVFVDEVLDSDLISRQPLYTSGGILSHYPPPAHRFAHEHKAFLFVGGLENPYQVAYSLPLASGEAPAFSPELSFRVPESTGPVTGFGTLDGALLVFTSRSAYLVSGDGPDATGGNNSFSDPQRVTDSVGCLEWRSIVAIPDGLLHKGASGIHLLSRGLQTVDVGSPVAAFNGQQVTRALHLPSTKEARFYCSTGRTLVWNYEYQQWSTTAPETAVDAVLLNGVPTWATGPAILADSGSTWRDNGAARTMTVGTAWLKVAGLHGLERVYRVLLLATYFGDFTLTTRVYYDFDDTDGQETHTNSITAAMARGSTLMLRQRLDRQKCTAVRFVWEITPTAGNMSGRAVSLTSMGLDVGAKRGPVKLGPGRTLS